MNKYIYFTIATNLDYSSLKNFQKVIKFEFNKDLYFLREYIIKKMKFTLYHIVDGEDSILVNITRKDIEEILNNKDVYYLKSLSKILVDIKSIDKIKVNIYDYFNKINYFNELKKFDKRLCSKLYYLYIIRYRENSEKHIAYQYINIMMYG